MQLNIQWVKSTTDQSPECCFQLFNTFPFVQHWRSHCVAQVWDNPLTSTMNNEMHKTHRILQSKWAASVLSDTWASRSRQPVLSWTSCPYKCTGRNTFGLCNLKYEIQNKKVCIKFIGIILVLFTCYYSSYYYF